MTEPPILTYTDESLNRKQTLTLWENKVHLQGKWFLRGEYEATFQLEAISPDYQDIAMRDNSFWWFSWLMIITLGIAGAFHAIPGTTTDSLFGMLITAFPFIFFAACLLTFKKVRMAQFLSNQGQLLFSVVHGGKEKHKFDQVVSQLVEQINLAEHRD